MRDAKYHLFLIIVLSISLVSSQNTENFSLKIANEISIDAQFGGNALKPSYLLDDLIVVQTSNSFDLYATTDQLSPQYISKIDATLLTGTDAISSLSKVVSDGTSNFYFTSEDPSIVENNQWMNYFHTASGLLSPQLISAIEIGFGIIKEMYYYSQSVYFTRTGNGYSDIPSNITRIDVSDPNNPLIASTTVLDNDRGEEITILGVKDNMLLVSYPGVGGTFLEALNLNTLDTVHSFSDSLFLGGVIFGDYYVGREYYVADITDLSAVTKVDVGDHQFQNTETIGVIGDHAYIVNNTYITVIDSDLEIVSGLEIRDEVDNWNDHRAYSMYNAAIDGYLIYLSDNDITKIIEFSTRDPSEVTIPQSTPEVTTQEDTTPEATTEETPIIYSMVVAALIISKFTGYKRNPE